MIDNTNPHGSAGKPTTAFSPLDPENVKATKVTLKNINREGIKYVHDVKGVTHSLRPGETVECELPEAEVERLTEISGGDNHQGLVIEGSAEAEDEEKQITRAEIVELEKKNLEAATKANAEQRSGEGQSGQQRAVAKEGSDKLGRGDLEAMTKDELLTYADDNDVEGVRASDNKAEIISAILKAQRSS